MAIPDLLRGCPLFFELYDPEIEKLTQYCSVYNVRTGDIIVEDGQPGDEIYVVLSGEAAIQKKLDGVYVEVVRLLKGDPFGEMVLVDEKVRSATIVAKTEAAVLEIRYANIFSLYEKEPRIFGLIMLNLSRLLARRLRGTNDLIQTLQATKKAA